MKLPPWLTMSVLATALVCLSFAIQGRIGLNLSDEGFLWYGTWRTAMGEVPLRDFQSYDPGRYLWGAFWFHVFANDGIIALRVSNSLFQIIGLTCGLLVLRRLTRSPWILTGGGALLLLWMLPRHKLFESSIALAAVYVAVLLLENPSLQQHFFSGLFVGLAAFFGRQHGFYTFVSFLLLIGFIWLKFDRQNLRQRRLFWGRWLFWVGGIIAGYSPMLIVLVIIPGLWNSFWQSLMFLVRIRNTNITLPVPTPWSVPVGSLDWITASHQIAVGLGFMVLPLFTITMLVYLLWQKPDRLRNQFVLVAATFLSLTYTHYAFSRADIPHLAQGIDPMLLGIAALIVYSRTKGRKVFSNLLAVVLIGLSLLGVGLVSPGIAKLRASDGLYVERTIRGDRLQIRKSRAQFIDTIQQFHDRNVSADEEIFLAPSIPALYPILGRRSPIWDIYLLFPETHNRQQQIIEQLHQQNVNWCILGDIALDGREELRFKNTHPLVWKEFSEHFELIQPTNLPGNYQIFRRNL
ncbi:MAG: hypothetical protein AB4040_07740 [Synechococcus sp.]